jgi:hypothetical protein
MPTTISPIDSRGQGRRYQWALNRNWLKSLTSSRLFFYRREVQPPWQYLHSKNIRNNNRLDRQTAWGKGSNFPFVSEMELGKSGFWGDSVPVPRRMTLRVSWDRCPSGTTRWSDSPQSGTALSHCRLPPSRPASKSACLEPRRAGRRAQLSSQRSSNRCPL